MLHKDKYIKIYAYKHENKRSHEQRYFLLPEQPLGISKVTYNIKETYVTSKKNSCM